MNYSVASLSTVAECDSVTTLVSKAKTDLVYKQGILQHRQANYAQSSIEIATELIAVNAQITACESIDATLPAGAAKDENTARLEGLNHRKFQLLKKQKENGSIALLETEMDFGLNEKQVAELDVILAAIANRKAAL